MTKAAASVAVTLLALGALSQPCPAEAQQSAYWALSSPRKRWCVCLNLDPD